MRIKCPQCNAEPPVKRWENHDFIATCYRKWKWLANHMVTDHMREKSLLNRRITARESRLRVVSIRRSKKRRAA